MKAVVVYESMFGSTHELAEAIATGLRPDFDVRVVRVDALQDEDVDDVNLLVAGAPTHVHTISTTATRHDAVSRSHDPAQDLHLDEPEMASGLREWFDRADAAPGLYAAFDTRTNIPRLLSGAASVRIGRELRKKGSVPVVPPESFLVDGYAGLKAGEADRGLAWGREVARAASLAANSS
jgi:hypothetical protein